MCGGLSTRQFDGMEALQDVSNLHVIEVGDAQPAFKPGAYLAGIILETLQGAEPGGVDNPAIADHTNLRVALDDAIQHLAASLNAWRAFSS